MIDATLPGASALKPIPAFRMRTLIGMRWFATIGQLLVTILVAFGLGFSLPLGPLLAVIAVGVWMNMYATFTHRPGLPMTDGAIMAHLAFDSIQIGSVLFLTGGILNPFAVWLVMPAMLASSSLPRPKAVVVVALVVALLTLLALVHYPLPWTEPGGLQLPRIYNVGIWAALTFAVAFTAAYAQSVSAEQAKLAAALTATQTALAREERLSALDGLAAAAAHELGTPLGTIQVTARELERELEGDLKEDAQLLISQTQRCQAILRRLSSAGHSGDAVHAILSLDDLLKEAAKPFIGDMAAGQDARVEFRLDPDSEGAMPSRLRRKPEIIYGLRNIVENAVKFAENTVTVEASWDDRFVTVTVTDDGPGFSPDVLARLGEPYPRGDHARGLTGSRSDPAPHKAGLGLGFFIAKTLLERTGARLRYGNRNGGLALERSGARVCVTWPLANIVVRPTSKQATRPIEEAPA